MNIHAHTQNHITDYLRVLYRRRWSALLVLLVVFVVGAFNTLKKTPIYTATAQILIEGESRRATTVKDALAADNYGEVFFQTQYKILQSRTLAWEVVQKLGLQASVPSPGTARPNPGFIRNTMTWVQHLIGAPERILPPPPDETTAQAQLVGGFIGGLTVIQQRATHIVNLVYESPDPVFAARAANTVAGEYIRMTLDTRARGSAEATDYLRDQVEQQRERVAASDRALQEYVEKNNAVGVDDRSNMLVARQADLNAKVMQAKTERIDKATLYFTLSSLMKTPEQLEAFPAIQTNDFVQRLKGDIQDLKKARVAQAERYKEGSPQLNDLDRQIRAAEAKMQAEIVKVVDSVKTELSGAEAKEASLTEMLNQQKAELALLNRKGVQYAMLKDEATSNRNLFEALLQRTNETTVSAEFKGSNVQIIDHAEVPRTPSSPNTRRDLMIALTMGCLLGFGVAFGLEYLDSRIRVPDEIKAHLGLPFLGLVPIVAPQPGGRAPLLTGTVPHDFSEAMRAIRTAVIFSSAAEGARSIVVTSTAPSEGKTLISSNLAASLAQSDMRTIIVDGDMRRPKIHETFEMSQEPGLSNVLVGTVKLEDAIIKTPTKNLHVLPAGHIPPNPAELLGSNRYRELLTALREHYDWIIIDAPPVMAVTDAVVMGNNSTGVVFVVGAEMTSRRLAAVAVEQLTNARAHFIGAVLNRANIRRHGYYYATYYRKNYTQAYTRTP